ncbi:MAG: HlyD family efflux transporter periplasmic adaptor subunit [Pirellulaceae bacterium]
MIRFLLCFATLLATVASVDAQEDTQATIVMRDLVVTVIDQVDVPALETGILESLDVTEGDRVTKGQRIGNLDARQIALQAKMAQADLRIAQMRAANHYESQLAKQDLALAEQTASQQKIASEIARKIADNNVRVLAATKASGIAKNEWDRANDARRKFADSVSTSELESLRLAFERSQLETQQATLDQSIDALTAKSKDQEALLHQLRVRQAEVSLEQAATDKAVLEIQTGAKQHAVTLADLSIQRHSIVAPINGVVVQRYQRAGQWVQPGTAIVRVVRMDRLQAEGFLDIATALKLRDRKDVTLQCDQLGEQSIQGTVTFVSPEVDPVNGQVRVLVQFDNTDEKIFPGMRVHLTANGK